MSVTALSAAARQYLPGAIIPLMVADNGASVTLKAAATGIIIDVWGYDLQSGGTATIDLITSTGSVSIMGAKALTAGQSVSSPLPAGRDQWDKAFPRCSTLSGDSLLLTNSGSSVTIT